MSAPSGYEQREFAAAFASSEEIKAMHEELGVPVEVIAAEKGTSVEAIKYVLSQVSASFRAETPLKERQELFSKEDVQDAVQTIKWLTKNAEAESVRGRMAEFVVNEALGRNAAKMGVSNSSQINVYQFNQTLLNARKAVQKSKTKKLLTGQGTGSYVQELPIHDKGEITTLQQVRELVELAKS
jgi:Fe2+ transport system protein B